MHAQPPPPFLPPMFFRTFFYNSEALKPLKLPRLVSCLFYFSFQNASKGKKMEKCYEGGISLSPTCELCTSHPLGFTVLFI